MAEFHYQVGDERVVVVVVPGDASYRVTIGERAYTVAATTGEQGELNLTLDGRRVRGYIVPNEGNQHTVWLQAVRGH